MKEEATVKTIRGTIVTLTCDDENCLGCSVGSGCSSHERAFDAENPQSLALKPGDRVEVYLRRRSAVTAGLLVFVVPLLLFLAGYLLARPVIGLENEAARSLCGLAGLAAGFVVALLYGKSRSAHQLPRIVGVHTGSRLR